MAPAAGILVWATGSTLTPYVGQELCRLYEVCECRHTTCRSQSENRHLSSVFISSLFSVSPLTLWDLPLGEPAALGIGELGTHQWAHMDNQQWGWGTSLDDLIPVVLILVT